MHVCLSFFIYKRIVMSTEKKKIGRPPEDIAKRLSKISMDKEKIKKLYLDGWTDQKVADFLGITKRAITHWKQINNFISPLKDWKTQADAKVEKSLYKRALGIKYDEVTYEKSNVGGLGIGFKKGEVSDIKHVDTYKTKVVTKKLPPDPTSMIFWLKNRQPDKWRDKKEVEVTELTKEQRDDELIRLKALMSD